MTDFYFPVKKGLNKVGRALALEKSAVPRSTLEVSAEVAYCKMWSSRSSKEVTASDFVHNPT